MENRFKSVIDVIDSHVSIRKYKDVDIPEDTLKTIIYSGVRAPSSANLQPYSIIAIKDRELKRKLSVLCGDQSHIRECSVFLIFVADYNRIVKAMEQLNIEPFQPNIYSLYIASVDAALAAQNIVVAAESMGYGICYIGAVQNRPCEIAKLLGLPRYTYPLFGLTIGVPDEAPKKRIRLDIDTILHLNGYEGDKADQVIRRYREEGYLDSLERRYSRYAGRNGRIEMRFKGFMECLESQGFKTSPSP
ncbi:MAG TPA: NADPH-dependent oxidoreductase [Thermoprotei archaeon]|nr:NADPH-dependent oxidoreductase [Thermoprotei archaeon]